MFSICNHIDEILTGVEGKVHEKKKIARQLEKNQDEINERINSIFWEEGIPPTKELVLKINEEIEKEKK